jgi:hypothetical protein
VVRARRLPLDATGTARKAQPGTAPQSPVPAVASTGLPPSLQRSPDPAAAAELPSPRPSPPASRGRGRTPAPAITAVLPLSQHWERGLGGEGDGAGSPRALPGAAANPALTQGGPVRVQRARDARLTPVTRTVAPAERPAVPEALTLPIATGEVPRAAASAPTLREWRVQMLQRTAVPAATPAPVRQPFGGRPPVEQAPSGRGATARVAGFPPPGAGGPQAVAPPASPSIPVPRLQRTVAPAERSAVPEALTLPLATGEVPRAAASAPTLREWRAQMLQRSAAPAASSPVQRQPSGGRTPDGPTSSGRGATSWAATPSPGAGGARTVAPPTSPNAPAPLLQRAAAPPGTPMPLYLSPETLHPPGEAAGLQGGSAPRTAGGEATPRPTAGGAPVLQRMPLAPRAAEPVPQLRRAADGAPAAPAAAPPSAELPVASADEPAPPLDVARVADQVYELLVSRLAGERRQRGW